MLTQRGPYHCTRGQGRSAHGPVTQPETRGPPLSNAAHGDARSAQRTRVGRMNIDNVGIGEQMENGKWQMESGKWTLGRPNIDNAFYKQRRQAPIYARHRGLGCSAPQALPAKGQVVGLLYSAAHGKVGST
jgi:hypothetical protein